MRASIFSVPLILALVSCGAKLQGELPATSEPALEMVVVREARRIPLSPLQGQPGGALRITASPSGEYYVLDRDHHRVLRYSPEGGLLGEAGGSGSGKLEFNVPVDVDADGQMLWVLDRQNRRLVRLNHALNYVEEISLQPGTDDLSKPLWYDGVGASSNGDVFLLDTREPQVVRISSAGDVLASYGGFGTGNGRLESPTDLDAGQDGSLYVTDGRRLLVFDRSGNVHKEIVYTEPLVRVEATGAVAWVTTETGQLLHYARGKLMRVVASSGSIPRSVDLTLGKEQEPVLLDQDWSVWLLELPPD